MITNHVLIVAGMHRSGTSLTANWLEKCGIHVGEDLIAADYSNPEGHYEDKEISFFQRRILRDNAEPTSFVTGYRPLTVSEARRQEAHDLIAARQQNQQWGWKDPRTSLLLDFWKTLLPDMKVIALYRPYTHVADSLLRRHAKRHRKKIRYRLLRPAQRVWWMGQFSFLNVPLMRRYLGTWCRYNADMLRFAAAYPDDVLVLHIDDLLPYAGALIAYANQVWNFDLEPVPITDVYNPALLTTTAMPLKTWWSTRLRPACQTVTDELDAWRQTSLERLADV